MAIESPLKLVNVTPSAHNAELLAELVPPREFAGASFENYIPDPNFESQALAVEASRAFVSAISSKKIAIAGVYLDGGFGVGKTHLLASIFHAAKGKKLFGSFLSYTALIGALGFAETLAALKKYSLIAIDEFELDDPGNTMLMSRFINELSASGVRFATTSNTPPNALGQGRFAAADFQREILGIGKQFNMVRIDGVDFRHRPFDDSHEVFDVTQLTKWAGDEGTLDDFDELLAHLAKVHPSLYSKLIETTARIAITGAHTFTGQDAALRFVTFVDRAYELQVAMRSSGIALTEVFPADFLSGGYAKKYLRAISRLGALAKMRTS